MMTLSGVRPEKTKPRLRAALTRAPSSWKQPENQKLNTPNTHTNQCCWTKCHLLNNLEISTWHLHCFHLCPLLLSHCHRETYKWMSVCGGGGCDTEHHIRMLQGEKTLSARFLFYCSLNCPKLHKTRSVLKKRSKNSSSIHHYKPNQ